MPARSWTQDQLKIATESSTTIAEIIQKLGLKYNSQTHRYIRNWILKYGFSTKHLRVDISLGRIHNQRTWSDASLKEAVQSCTSIRQVALKLGLSPIGTNYMHVKKHCERLNLDLSKMGVAKLSQRKTLEEMLQIGTEINSYELKIKLFKAGLLVEVCKMCGLGPNWQGRKLALQLDHENGNRNDNRLENLRILCPNCHSQTITYSNSSHHR